MLKSVFAAGLAGALALCARASFDPSTFDLSVKPQDDFFRYANGTWIKNTPVPPEYSRWGSFDALAERNKDLLKGICEAAAAKGTAGTPVERMVGDFYQSGIDMEAANAAGVAPIQPELDAIASIKDHGRGDGRARPPGTRSTSRRASFSTAPPTPRTATWSSLSFARADSGCRTATIT